MSTCPICREEGGLLAEMACPAKHSFHSACIEAWMKNNNYTCPCCRIKVKRIFANVEEFLKNLKPKCSVNYSIFGRYINDFPLDWKIKCIKHDGFLLHYIDDKTEELCRLAVKKNGSALQNVPIEFRTPELCRLAVEKDGCALESVPEHMKTPELCRLAVEKDGRALESVPKGLKTPELCSLAVEKYGCILRCVPEKLKTLELCRIAVASSGFALHYVPDHVKTQQLCLLAARKDKWSLSDIPRVFKSRELCRLAMSHKSEYEIYSVPEELRTPEFFSDIINDGNGKHVIRDFQKDMNREFCLSLAKINGKFVQFLPKKYETLKFYLEAARLNRDAIAYIPEFFVDEVESLLE